MNRAILSERVKPDGRHRSWATVYLIDQLCNNRAAYKSADLLAMLGEVERRGLQKPDGWERWFVTNEGVLDGFGRLRLEDPEVLQRLVSGSEDVNGLVLKLSDLGLSDHAARHEASRAFQECGKRLLDEASFQFLQTAFFAVCALMAVALGRVSFPELRWAPVIPLLILFLGFSNYRQGRLYLAKGSGARGLEELKDCVLGSWIWAGSRRHLKNSIRARVVGGLCLLVALLAFAWPRIEEALDPNILRGTVRDSSVGNGYVYLYFSKNSPRDSVAVSLSEFRQDLLLAGIGNSDAMFASAFLSLGSRYRGERIVARGRAVKQADGSTCVFVERLMDIRFIE